MVCFSIYFCLLQTAFCLKKVFLCHDLFGDLYCSAQLKLNELFLSIIKVLLAFSKRYENKNNQQQN